MIRALILPSVVFASVWLSGCGGGGGKTPTPTPEPTPAIQEGVISGKAFIGRVDQAGVRVLTFPEREPLPYGGTADESGNFSFPVSLPSGLYELRVSGGVYFDIASGDQVSLETREFSAVIAFTEGEQIEVYPTPFTEWARCYSNYLIGEGVAATDAVAGANQRFSGLIGAQIPGTYPVDVTEPASVQLDDTVRYGYLIAAISNMTSEMAARDPLRNTRRRITYSTINFIIQGCVDLADGVFDGRRLSGTPITMGNTELNANHYRSILARHWLLFVGDEASRNQLDFTAAELFYDANTYSMSIDSIFQGVDPELADIQGPTLVSDYDFDGLKAGIEEIAFETSDPQGVVFVDMYIDDVLYARAIDPADPTFAVDTAQYFDRVHTLTVVAMDSVGNETRLEYFLETYNTAASIDIVSPDNDLTNEATYRVVGSYYELDVPIAAILVNGETATVNAEMMEWLIDIELTPGINIIEATVVDEIGNEATDIITVLFDDIAPSVGFISTRVRASNLPDPTFNICDEISIIGGTNGNAFCLLLSKISLGGVPITPNLSSQSIWSLGIKFHDSPTREVFTPVEDIVVEYQYFIDGLLVVDWTPAPRLESFPDRSYLPITTEYLGESFYAGDIDDEHNVVFRLTDRAGNRSEYDFTFRLNLIDDSGAS